jgi:hypothetical protein
MPSTTRYRRGDIVLVSFPFTDLSSSKRRPALVISPDRFNDRLQDLVLVALTSRLTDPELMVIDPPECIDGILPKRSAIKDLHDPFLTRRQKDLRTPARKVESGSQGDPDIFLLAVVTWPPVARQAGILGGHGVQMVTGRWPSYQYCLDRAPIAHGQDRPDIGRADFAWCVTAIDWGWSIEATADRLLEESPKAHENGAGLPADHRPQRRRRRAQARARAGINV